MIPKIDGVAGPVSGDARIDGKHRATDAEPENPFQASAIKPARRTLIPRPSASAHMGRLSVYIARKNVGLNFVALHARHAKRYG